MVVGRHLQRVNLIVFKHVWRRHFGSANGVFLSGPMKATSISLRDAGMVLCYWPFGANTRTPAKPAQIAVIECSKGSPGRLPKLPGGVAACTRRAPAPCVRRMGPAGRSRLAARIYPRIRGERRCRGEGGQEGCPASHIGAQALQAGGSYLLHWVLGWRV